MSFIRIVGLSCLLALAAQTATASDSKTVVGPSNLALADGSAALMAGHAEKGIRLTLQGLSMSNSDSERVSGWSNLCAGYLMLNRYDEALGYCNQAIEADPEHWRALSNRALIHIFRREFDLAAEDIGRAQKIAPRARIPRQVRAMLRDAVDPVMPTVTIDDRRRPAASEAAD